MEIVENFAQGKSDLACEDVIYISDHFLALIDGATAKHGQLYSGGRTSGKFAADTVASALDELPPDADARSGLLFISDFFARSLAREDVLPPAPEADLIVYSISRQEIWRVGTIHLLLDSLPYPGGKHLDEINAAARAAYSHALLLDGSSIQDLQKTDPGRELIMPLLRKNYLFANNTSSPFAYGCINGSVIPEDLLDVWVVPDGCEVVFASDGYPLAKPSLAEAELALEKRLADDPMMISHPPQTKGRGSENVSYDDRSYLRFIQ